MPRGMKIKPIILKHFIEHPGAVVFFDDLQEAIISANGEKASRPGIQFAVKQLIEEGKPIEVESNGRAWIYRPNGRKNDKRMFEELAVTKSGDILIQDELGNVYKAVEL